MAAWVVCALCALVIVKPQEFVLALHGLPLVHVAFGAALLAAAADVVRRRLRLSLAPQVPFVLAFFVWASLTTALKQPDVLPDQAIGLVILAGLFLAVSVGCASSAGVRAFALMFLACAALVTWVAIEQSGRPLGCFLGASEDWEGKGELSYDGRPCETVLDCRADAPVPDGNYRCERVGPLATCTMGRRVRYRGSLADPNELALMVSLAIPFAIALAERRSAPLSPARRPVLLPPLLGDRLLARAAALLRSLPVGALIAAVGVAVVLSQSRTGLLVFLAVLGIHALRRLGAWGVALGCVLGPPMILLGGRSGAEADDSTDERAEILREAFEMIRHTRGVGLGLGQFSDESSVGLTAHNAYVLAAAETGFVGLCLFGLALYLSIKVPIAIWFGDYRVDARLGRLAPALAIVMCGALLGIAFLSWTYKDILYMLMGASAALYSAARAQDPRVRVRLSWSEAAIVVLSLFGILAAFYVGSRLHGR